MLFKEIIPVLESYCHGSWVQRRLCGLACVSIVQTVLRNLLADKEGWGHLPTWQSLSYKLHAYKRSRKWASWLASKLVSQSVSSLVSFRKLSGVQWSGEELSGIWMKWVQCRDQVCYREGVSEERTHLKGLSGHGQWESNCSLYCKLLQHQTYSVGRI
jgi:hypothetical protein